jgi:zinc transporter, ZIP family
VLAAFLWGGLAAAALLVGYVLSSRKLSNRTIGLVMGFGAGALISAIAYELVPESVNGGLKVAVFLLAGAVAFFVLDWAVDRWGASERKTIDGTHPGGSGAAVFIGTLLDNIPESIVLGMGLATGGSIQVAFLVAVFVSNVPEGVAGTLNLVAAGHARRRVGWLWVALVLISAACAALGYGLIQWLPSSDGTLTQAFAAGAMLTMLADAMIPEAYEHGGRLTGLATVLGFVLAALLSALG